MPLPVKIRLKMLVPTPVSAFGFNFWGAPNHKSSCIPLCSQQDALARESEDRRIGSNTSTTSQQPAEASRKT
jgi:hypothetical protein